MSRIAVFNQFPELLVKAAQEILQTMGFRTFVPLVAACPGCGRTTSTTFQELAGGIQKFIIDSMPEWKKRNPIAVSHTHLGKRRRVVADAPAGT